jgi:hypothetical protein
MEQEGHIQNDKTTPPKSVTKGRSASGAYRSPIRDVPPFYRLPSEPIEAEFRVLFRGMISSCRCADQEAYSLPYSMILEARCQSRCCEKGFCYPRSIGDCAERWFSYPIARKRGFKVWNRTCHYPITLDRAVWRRQQAWATESERSRRCSCETLVRTFRPVTLYPQLSNLQADIASWSCSWNDAHKRIWL